MQQYQVEVTLKNGHALEGAVKTNAEDFDEWVVRVFTGRDVDYFRLETYDDSVTYIRATEVAAVRELS